MDLGSGGVFWEAVFAAVLCAWSLGYLSPVEDAELQPAPSFRLSAAHPHGVKHHLRRAAVVPKAAFVRVWLGVALKLKKGGKPNPNPRS